MNRFEISAERRALRTLDYELELVRGAIDLVASGGAPRVRLASLSFGEQLLEPARLMAISAGVRIIPAWTSDEGGASITVEPLVDA
ncbi:MAG TPA: hypothetical protein VE011_03105 [Candidatus Dormibacteraeota bacterium]|nr:hypothetical protein [Candidatus Dormibacteraeota bacterium]